MICSNCTEAKPIPACSGSLIIGTVDSTDDVFVFVQNIATDYVMTQQVTPDGDGKISISLSDPYPDFFSPNFYFKLWVSSTEDVNDVLPVTVGGQEYECFTLLFQKVYSEDETVKLDTVTLSI